MPEKAESTTKSTVQASRKKTHVLPLLALAAVVLCAAVVFLTRGDNAPSVVVRDGNGVRSIGPGESLVIPTAGITTKASFHAVTVNGTPMEVITVRDSAGHIRTAFNTCQICYDSGKGYYIQSGPYLVCQNCGNRFSTDQIGIASGGCNPWPIFDENKTVSTDSIAISYEFLAEAREIFVNWKASSALSSEI